MSIGDKIKAKRKEKKLTQNELGTLCGMSGNTIKRYELGERNPKIVTLKKIALALDVKSTYFLDLDLDEETIIEKALGLGYRQLKIYAEAFDMSTEDFLLMIGKQGVQFALATLTGSKQKFINDKLAELDTLSAIVEETGLLNELDSQPINTFVTS